MHKFLLIGMVSEIPVFEVAMQNIKISFFFCIQFQIINIFNALAHLSALIKVLANKHIQKTNILGTLFKQSLKPKAHFFKSSCLQWHT